jgi:alkylation response protein AidB-like acyl-CoA dehydrogenase
MACDVQVLMNGGRSSDRSVRLIVRCLQLHGGYGYIAEYAIGRSYLDARIQTIYGGTTEIMKEIIGRDLAPTTTERAKR